MTGRYATLFSCGPPAQGPVKILYIGGGPEIVSCLANTILSKRLAGFSGFLGLLARYGSLIDRLGLDQNPKARS